jgi:hypothetical protein
MTFQLHVISTRSSPRHFDSIARPEHAPFWIHHFVEGLAASAIAWVAYSLPAPKFSLLALDFAAQWVGWWE